MSARNEATVFVVDDDDAVRDSLRTLLTHKGFAVSAFASADAFLAAQVASSPGCLLLDVRMPGMDGISLLKRLKEDGSSLPVIMITGHGDVPTAIRAMRLGAFDFLEKPFTQDIILGAIAAAHRFRATGQDGHELAASAARRIERLTDREREVMRCLVDGQTGGEIARRIGIAARTVEVHRAHIMEKTEARTLSALVRMSLAVESSALDRTPRPSPGGCVFPANSFAYRVRDT